MDSIHARPQAFDRPALGAFDGECSALAEVLRSLSPGDLGRPTNCPPWTLHELIVHIAFSIGVPDRLQTAGLPSEPADYYRRRERDTSEYRTANVERTQRMAASIGPEQTRDVFTQSWKRATEVFARHDPHQRIDAAGQALTVDAYVLTRLMSVAAHGLDVAITLDRPPWTTKQALQALRPVLIDLLQADPPASWTDQDLLALGTGRRPLSPTDRDALGSLESRFPLLS